MFLYSIMKSTLKFDISANGSINIVSKTFAKFFFVTKLDYSVNPSFQKSKNLKILNTILYKDSKVKSKFLT